eukprot:SAG11_NODE_980_length_6319_cov_2.389068_5_plen_121_part_00
MITRLNAASATDDTLAAMLADEVPSAAAFWAAQHGHPALEALLTEHASGLPEAFFSSGDDESGGMTLAHHGANVGLISSLAMIAAQLRERGVDVASLLDGGERTVRQVAQGSESPLSNAW